MKGAGEDGVKPSTSLPGSPPLPVADDGYVEVPSNTRNEGGDADIGKGDGAVGGEGDGYCVERPLLGVGGGGAEGGAVVVASRADGSGRISTTMLNGDAGQGECVLEM